MAKWYYSTWSRFPVGAQGAFCSSTMHSMRLHLGWGGLTADIHKVLGRVGVLDRGSGRLVDGFHIHLAEGAREVRLADLWLAGGDTDELAVGLHHSRHLL